MSLLCCAYLTQTSSNLLTQDLRPTAETLIGNIEFVGGQTDHVPGRLITGPRAVLYISGGFKAVKIKKHQKKQEKKLKGTPLQMTS